MSALSLLAQSDSGSSGGGIVQLLILLLIPVAMYFLLIRPQRKRMKDQAAMQSALGVGDEVITSSGIYGFITGEESDKFWLEIDDDVQIRVAKAAIQGRVIDPAAAPAKNTPSKNTPSKELPSKDTPSKKLPSKELPSEELPSEECAGTGSDEP